MEHAIHFGLDIAEVTTILEKSNFEVLMDWARSQITGWQIRVGSRNYDVLLDAPEVFEIREPQHIQEYFSMIYAKCMENGDPLNVWEVSGNGDNSG